MEQCLSGHSLRLILDLDNYDKLEFFVHVCLDVKTKTMEKIKINAYFFIQKQSQSCPMKGGSVLQQTLIERSVQRCMTRVSEGQLKEKKKTCIVNVVYRFRIPQ